MSKTARESMKEEKMIAANLDELHWKPKDTLPPGANSANVYGVPAEGNYAFYGKFPQNYTVPMHWHTSDVWVVIVKGSMSIRRDGFPDLTIDRGGFFFLPGGMQYVAHCNGECIFLAYGFKPFDIFYRSPSEDARNRAKSHRP